MRSDIRYDYRVRRTSIGYAARIERTINGVPAECASYQDGFGSPREAYKFAKWMAKCVKRRHGEFN